MPLGEERLRDAAVEVEQDRVAPVPPLEEHPLPGAVEVHERLLRDARGHRSAARVRDGAGLARAPGQQEAEQTQHGAQREQRRRDDDPRRERLAASPWDPASHALRLTRTALAAGSPPGPSQTMQGIYGNPDRVVECRSEGVGRPGMPPCRGGRQPRGPSSDSPTAGPSGGRSMSRRA